MEQQGGTEEFRRTEALIALATLSIYDPQFRSDIRESNLEYTLWRYGFALSPWEAQEARSYLAENADLSDDDFVQGLREIGGPTDRP